MSNKNYPITYLNGVLIGINAIKDAYLWVDSPDCFFFKMDHIYLNHDLNSNLKHANGLHKVLNTVADVDNVIGNRNDKFIKTLKSMVNRKEVKLTFVTSMPMSQLVGVDYDGLINIVKQNTGNELIFNIPSRSMTSCWLDGYSDLLFSIAKNIKVEKKEIVDIKKVAIIGNLFDRNEGDCIGNIEELKNIFEGLGLEVVSIWLDGGKYDDILNVQEAGTIISLPYGRKAAKKMAKKLGVKILELDLPFGINNTIEFIKSIGEYFNIDNKKTEDFIYKELNINNNIGILRKGVYQTLFNKNISFYGDPYLINGIIDFSEMFGLNLIEVFVHGEEKHLKNNLNKKYSKITLDIYFELLGRVKNVDLSIFNTANMLDNIKNKVLEFGFPSYTYHCFTKQPFYGIKGGLNFINRVYNSLA